MPAMSATDRKHWVREELRDLVIRAAVYLMRENTDADDTEMIIREASRVILHLGHAAPRGIADWKRRADALGGLAAAKAQE